MEGQDPSAVSLAKELYCDPRKPFGRALKRECECLDWAQIEVQGPFAVNLVKEENCYLQKPFGLTLKQRCGYLQEQN